MDRLTPPPSERCGTLIPVLLKLVLLCDALHCAMKNCLLTNKSVFEDEISKIKDSIRQLFGCRQMLDPETVKTVLMPIPSVRSYLNPTVTNARAFYMDVINKALKLELAGLFGTEQISGYIDRIFRGNLRSNDIPRDYRTSMDILNPFDVIKIRMQVAGDTLTPAIRYCFVFSCVTAGRTVNSIENSRFAVPKLFVASRTRFGQRSSVRWPRRIEGRDGDDQLEEVRARRVRGAERRQHNDERQVSRTPAQDPVVGCEKTAPAEEFASRQGARGR